MTRFGPKRDFSSKVFGFPPSLRSTLELFSSITSYINDGKFEKYS